MSRSLKKGDIVYPAYSPVQVGVVISVGERPLYGPSARPEWRGKPQDEMFTPITVRMKNGKEITRAMHIFRNYLDLVEQHEEKGKKFRKIYEELKKGV